MEEEYREFMRKSMERNEERSRSKRMQRHIMKRVESKNSARKPEPNIYATKQRYKYSYFNLQEPNEDDNKFQ